MAARKRVSDELAFILHHYDWSESSLILETFTRHHGRVALVARGAKKPSSNFRPVLLPLQTLRVGWTESPAEHAEIHALKGAEWVGGATMPRGDALLSGYYLNELLLRLLARDDPHTRLFDIYADVVRLLADAPGETLQVVLRSFELLLLREVGLLPDLAVQSSTRAPLDPQARYVLVPDGLREATAAERSPIAGAQWLAIQETIDASESDSVLRTVLPSCAAVAAELKPMLRQLLHHHAGVSMLKTRRLMQELQNL